MQYLRTDHTAPAYTFTVDGMRHITAYYVLQAEAGNTDAIALLAQADIVPHHELANPDDRICGSTWTQQADGWHETPIGTPEQIAAAMAAKELSEMRPRWSARSAKVKARTNDDVALDSAQSMDARFRALRNLIRGE